MNARDWDWSMAPRPESPPELSRLDIRAVHAGTSTRLIPVRSPDRRGTVEVTSKKRRPVQPVEPRNGLPVPARYEYRRGGRISPLTARIMAEIGAERETLWVTQAITGKDGSTITGTARRATMAPNYAQRGHNWHRQ